MPQKLFTQNTVPNKGFRFLVPETNFLVEAPDWDTLTTEVFKHRRANGLGSPADYRDTIEDWLCNQLPSGFCYQVDKNDPKNLGGLSFEQVKQGTATLVEWFFKGGKKVDKSEAESRTKVCSGCKYNQEPQGCSGCAKSSVHELIDKVVGGESHAGDSTLKGCVVCGCSLRAKVWIPLDIIKNHTTPERNDLFPEWCWAKVK